MQNNPEISGVQVRRAIPKPSEKFQAGAVFCHSWGYEQTNIDFYMIKSIKGQFAMVVALESYVSEEDKNMTRLNLPSFKEAGPVFRRKIKVYSDGIYIKGVGSLWNGKQKRSTHYA